MKTEQLHGSFDGNNWVILYEYKDTENGPVYVYHGIDKNLCKFIRLVVDNKIMWSKEQ